MKGAKQNVAIGASVLTAIAASLCCIGPLLVALLGLSGFAASSLFTRWRPLFLLATGILLGLAWYLTYRKPKEACAEGTTCATKPVSKWNKTVLWFATGFVLISAAFPSLSSAILRATQTNSDACCVLSTIADDNTAVLKVKIPSMDCATCALNIQSVLKKHAGVQQAQVNFDTREAVIRYDGTKLSPEKILAAIDQTGFKAEPSTQKEKR
ncbi:MAG: cation transporter [Verrucomicrobia bacterium]|nr:cation transporter [Verrucomicrobiota bacterium]